VVNKVDGRDPDLASSEFFALGVTSMHAIAASQGRGVRGMLEACWPFPANGTDAGRGAR
jgi:GTP-binding protein